MLLLGVFPEQVMLTGESERTFRRSFAPCPSGLHHVAAANTASKARNTDESRRALQCTGLWYGKGLKDHGEPR